MTDTKRVPDFLVRAAKTFIQAFIPVIIANTTMIMTHVVNWDFADWKGWLMPIIISAVAAGIAAIWNLILEKINARTQAQIFAAIDQEELAKLITEIIMQENKKVEDNSEE